MSAKKKPDPLRELLAVLADHLKRGRHDVMLEKREGEQWRKIKLTETNFGKHVHPKAPRGNSTVTITIHEWWAP